MDNKKLKELVAAWCKSASKNLPTSTACDTRAVTWEASGPVWWSNYAANKCIGLTVRGYVQKWSGTIRINLIIDVEGNYFVMPKTPGDYGYLREEAVAAFKAKIPEGPNPLVAHLERWKEALIADIQKLEFSDVQLVQDEGTEPKAFFTIRHPEIPKLAATVDVDHDTCQLVFGPQCKGHPMAKMLAESLWRVERDLNGVNQEA